jgi:hypothetical protein
VRWLCTGQSCQAVKCAVGVAKEAIVIVTVNVVALTSIVPELGPPCGQKLDLIKPDRRRDLAFGLRSVGMADSRDEAIFAGEVQRLRMETWLPIDLVQHHHLHVIGQHRRRDPAGGGEDLGRHGARIQDGEKVHATEQVYFGPLVLRLRTENTVSANAGN